MDLRKVKKLIELLESSALVEMEITEGDSTIRLSRAAYSSAEMPARQHPASISHITTDQAPSIRQDIAPEPAHIETGSVVKSPMVGTFYQSASADSAPYVTIGSVIKPGDILCIIEAMKTFNQLEADIAGTVKAIYKSNSAPVEFGEALFLVE